jgi:hypothetical protein
MNETLLDDPVVTVHVPPRLRGYTNGAEEATVSGVTVREALASLEREHPGILAEVMSPGGELRPGFELYLGGTPIAELAGLETPVGAEELVAILEIRSASRP